MKVITLRFADDVWKELQGAVFVRLISGNSEGLVDEFLTKMVQRADHGELDQLWEFKKKEQ